MQNKAVSYLEEKIKTPIRIAKLEIDLPKRMVAGVKARSSEARYNGYNIGI